MAAAYGRREGGRASRRSTRGRLASASTLHLEEQAEVSHGGKGGREQWREGEREGKGREGGANFVLAPTAHPKDDCPPALALALAFCAASPPQRRMLIVH